MCILVFFRWLANSLVLYAFVVILSIILPSSILLLCLSLSLSWIRTPVSPLPWSDHMHSAMPLSIALPPSIHSLFSFYFSGCCSCSLWGWATSLCLIFFLVPSVYWNRPWRRVIMLCDDSIVSEMTRLNISKWISFVSILTWLQGSLRDGPVIVSRPALCFIDLDLKQLFLQGILITFSGQHDLGTTNGGLDVNLLPKNMGVGRTEL